MDRENIHDWLCGPVVAVATPFKEDFSLDLTALQDNIRFMIEGGVTTGDGVLLVGAAGGEFPTLNLDERKAVMDAAVAAAQGQGARHDQHPAYRLPGHPRPRQPR